MGAPSHDQHLRRRAASGPPTQASVTRDTLNDRLAAAITAAVGTMWAFYGFTGLALVSLPSVLSSHSAVVIVGWVAQTLLQLVLLAVLQTSANRAGRAADARALATWQDAEMLLHGQRQQIALLEALLDREGLAQR